MNAIALILLLLVPSINGMEQNIDAKTEPMPLSKMDKLVSFATAFRNKKISFEGDKLQFQYYNNKYLKTGISWQISMKRAKELIIEIIDMEKTVTRQSCHTALAYNMLYKLLITGCGQFCADKDLMSSLQEWESSNTRAKEFVDLINSSQADNFRKKLGASKMEWPFVVEDFRRELENDRVCMYDLKKYASEQNIGLQEVIAKYFIKLKESRELVFEALDKGDIELFKKGYENPLTFEQLTAQQKVNASVT